MAAVSLFRGSNMATVTSCENRELTIRAVARKGYGSIAYEAKPNGLLTRGP